MVDPNPFRGMPIQLKRYWLAGKGAAKIRWNTPGDYLRCVRALRTKFPQNPQGLCNILHTQATGGPPGHGSLEHALEQYDAEVLLAAAPMLGNTIWMAPLAPIGRRTGDGRMFTADSLTFRTLPLPLEWVKTRTVGHQGAVTVGRILGVSMGPDHDGQEYAWGWGDLFSPDVIPEVAQAMALIEGGVAGLSLDPGGAVQARRVAEDSNDLDFVTYRAGGATLVSIPAFEGQFILLGDDDSIFEALPDLVNFGLELPDLTAVDQVGDNQAHVGQEDEEAGHGGSALSSENADNGEDDDAYAGAGADSGPGAAGEAVHLATSLVLEVPGGAEKEDDQPDADEALLHAGQSDTSALAAPAQPCTQGQEQCDDNHADDASHSRFHDNQSDTFAVNTSGWRGLPIADREAPVDRDDAILRISAWAQNDPAKLNRAFLWRHPQGNPQSVYSYRLPVGDIINDELHLIYHAIYAASALLEGAHGGLPNIPEAEKAAMRRVISSIYRKMAETFDDPTIKASWDRETKRSNGVTGQEDEAGDEGDMALTDIALEVLMEDFASEFAVRSSGWGSLPVADVGRSWDEGAARAALDSWAGDDIDKYARAFLWRGGDNKSDMKFPIAMPIDGKLTIVPRAVSAALGRVGQASIPAAAKMTMRNVIEAINRRIRPHDGGDDDNGDMTLLASAPVTPPASWFDVQDFPDGSGIRITREGQFTAWLAPWRGCHRSVGRGACIRAPRSAADYAHFHLGSVVAADGSVIRVGKVTLGGGHADTRLGIIPTLEHYDNAGSCVAVVRAHETEYGIQLAGALVPETTVEQSANLRRSPLSGDWRASNGNLELVAALAVNVPGFPVFTLDETDAPLSLIASLGEAEEHDHEELAVTHDEVVDEVARRALQLIAEREAAAWRARTLADQQKYQDGLNQERRARRLAALRGE